MANAKKVPEVAYDIIMHQEDDNKEVAVFPFTRYSNILSAPNVVKDATDTLGAPFHLLETGEEEMTMDDIRALTNSSFTIL